jgi:hypothetical protein
MAPVASVPYADDVDDMDDTAETPAPPIQTNDPTPTLPLLDDTVAMSAPGAAEDPNDQVWRMLDEEVAQGRGQVPPLPDVTGEMPRPQIPPLPDPFHIDDEELQ